jgi:hypothetical protein
VVIVAAALLIRNKRANEAANPPVLPPPVVPVESPSQGNSPAPHDSKAEEVSRKYREARSALESGDYDAAGKAFLALLQHSSVQEPTRSWAGVEAVLTALLDGKTQEARKHAMATLNHLRSLPAEAQPFPGPLANVLERLNGPRPVQSQDSLPAEAGAARLACIMLASLKSWELGLLDQAADGFREATAMTLPPDQKWAAIYQRLAADYLSDYESLKSKWFEALPETADGCDTAIDELNTVQASLKTRGRARFNVRSWQQELASHRNRILRQSQNGDSPAPARTPKISEVMAQIDGFARDARYTEACEFLEKLSAEELVAARNALHALAKSAKAFIVDLEAQLALAPVQIELTLRSGEEISAVRIDGAAGLTVTTTAGKSATARWSDFYPDAPILLHQKLLGNYPGNDDQHLRRNEGAIAHLWLVGERERAANAAGKLSANNPDFAARWQKKMGDLPK